MTGINGHITRVELVDAGPDNYSFIQLTVYVPIPRNNAYRPEYPQHVSRDPSKWCEWDKSRMADYEKEMETYRAKTAQWQCAFDNAYSLCLEEIDILPLRELKRVQP